LFRTYFLLPYIVPVVKGTWGAEAKHIEYYSEVEDPSIPTTFLPVPNTEKGSS
jgi:UDP-glucose:O-linked fucose beta-1,3-glucosyltransferase